MLGFVLQRLIDAEPLNNDIDKTYSVKRFSSLHNRHFCEFCTKKVHMPKFSRMKLLNIINVGKIDTRSGIKN